MPEKGELNMQNFAKDLLFGSPLRIEKQKTDKKLGEKQQMTGDEKQDYYDFSKMFKGFFACTGAKSP